MKAMIFAAGLGTRLKPLTDTLPKALVPIGGVPLLEILIRKLINQGITEMVVNVHHFAPQIITFLAQHQNFGVHITVSHEEQQLLETGGGLKKAAPYLMGEAPILVHNVDILSNVNLEALTQCHLMADATLLVSPRKTNRYLLFDETNRLVGWTNLQTGEVKSPYPNLDPVQCKHYAFAGIQLINPSLLAEMAHQPDRFSIIDFYLGLCHQKQIMGYPQPNLTLMDVGKIDTLDQAAAFQAQLQEAQEG